MDIYIKTVLQNISYKPKKKTLQHLPHNLPRGSHVFYNHSDQMYTIHLPSLVDDNTLHRVISDRLRVDDYKLWNVYYDSKDKPKPNSNYFKVVIPLQPLMIAYLSFKNNGINIDKPETEEQLSRMLNEYLNNNRHMYERVKQLTNTIFEQYTIDLKHYDDALKYARSLYDANEKIALNLNIWEQEKHDGLIALENFRRRIVECHDRVMVECGWNTLYN